MSFFNERFGIILLALLAFPPLLACTGATDNNGDPAKIAAARAVIEGVWQPAGSGIKDEGTAMAFSWGDATVPPNSGLIVDLGAIVPFIQYQGEHLVARNIIASTRRRAVIDVSDPNIDGPGAFTQMLFRQNLDGTVTVNFRRRDGTFYGAVRYERRFGPVAK